MCTAFATIFKAYVLLLKCFGNFNKIEFVKFLKILSNSLDFLV